ncbi:MAG: hypothetical protein C4326_04315 [Ignavibacteria bacterium]
MHTVRIGFGYSVSIVRHQEYTKALSELDALVFPELLDGGYAALKRGLSPHTPNDPLLTIIREASERFPCTIIAGTVYYHDGTDSPTNTTLVFSRGKLIHRYDKIHLFKPTDDHVFFRSGKPVARTFKLATRAGTLRAGVVICYDLRFPELVRVMASKGMQVLFVPARWPAERDLAWRTLLLARAIENQIFVLGCNARDIEGGRSYAFDPLGEKLFLSPPSQASLLSVCELDLAKLSHARTLHSNLQDAIFLKAVLKQIKGIT